MGRHALSLLNIASGRSGSRHPDHANANLRRNGLQQGNRTGRCRGDGKLLNGCDAVLRLLVQLLPKLRDRRAVRNTIGRRARDVHNRVFAQGAGQPALRIAFEVAAQRVRLILGNVVEAQAGRIQDHPMAGERAQRDWVVWRNLIERIPVDRWVSEDLKSDRYRYQAVGRVLSDGGHNAILDLRPRWVHRVQIDVDLRRSELEMMMSVVDTRDSRTAVQVNSIGLRTDHRPDRLCLAGRHDALATDGHRLHIGSRSNPGKNLPIEQYRVWFRLLCRCVAAGAHNPYDRDHGLRSELLQVCHFLGEKRFTPCQVSMHLRIWPESPQSEQDADSWISCRDPRC